jgi:hypothetical protein
VPRGEEIRSRLAPASRTLADDICFQLKPELSGPLDRRVQAPPPRVMFTWAAAVMNSDTVQLFGCDAH